MTGRGGQSGVERRGSGGGEWLRGGPRVEEDRKSAKDMGRGLERLEVTRIIVLMTKDAVVRQSKMLP